MGRERMRMKNLSLRLKFLGTYLLLLIPIIIFSLVLYFSSMDRGTQYTNTASLQQFTYAAENISAIIGRLEYAAGNAYSLEEQLTEDQFGRARVRSEGTVTSILAAMEERLSPDVDLFFYLHGDKNLYTSQGMLNYSLWEGRYEEEFNLPMSRMYYSLLTYNREDKLMPLKAADGSQAQQGLAYLVPFPVQSAQSQAMLIYILHSGIIRSEFENYMGSLAGDLFIYDDQYRVLYSQHTGDEMEMPFEATIKARGVGLRQVTYEGKDWVLLRVSDSGRGLHCAMVVPREVFYADNLGTQRIMLYLILALIIVICGMAVWAAFINYKPIHELVLYVAGRRNKPNSKKNELEIIKTYYDQTIGEAEELSSQLSEMTPMVAQQFVNKLIFGKISSREEFNDLSRSADILFLRPWTAALYILPPAQAQVDEKDDAALERCSLTASRFHPAQCTVAVGELAAENALCVILNFAAEEGKEAEESLELARQLSTMFAEAGMAQARIGVGKTYRDPMMMPESFAEASASVQLAPSSRETVLLYTPPAPEERVRETSAFFGVSDMSLTLLTEGIHRGEKSVAFRALNDILSEITAVTDSFIHFRFYCTEILSAMIRQAAELGIPLEGKYRDSLIDYKSQAEFSEKAAALLEYLCREVRSRIQREDDETKRRLMDYIFGNYKRFDLSIQMVSDATNLRKSQITSLLRESTGQNFVQYVSYLRMNEFKRMLLETDLSIQQCVSEIGYSDVPNFLRKFKSVEGCTPGQYRALHRQQREEM